MTTSPADETRKPARRRVVRRAAGPAATTAPDLGISLPTRDADTVEPAPDPVNASASEQAPAAAPVTESSPRTGAAPARRSRRVSRPASTPGETESGESGSAAGTAPAAGRGETAGLTLDAIVLPDRSGETAAAAEPRTAATRTAATRTAATRPAATRPARAAAEAEVEPRRAARSLDEIELPAGGGPAPAPSADKSAGGAGTRPRRAKAPAEPTVGAEPTEATPTAASDPAAAEAATPQGAARGTRTRRTRGGQAAPAAQEPAAQEPAVSAPTASAAGAGRTAAAAEATAPSADAATTAAHTPGSPSPRLATTAMLFQAPDLTGPRRSRRAQAPAGPPAPQSSAQSSAPQSSAPESSAPQSSAPSSATDPTEQADAPAEATSGSGGARGTGQDGPERGRTGRTTKQGRTGGRTKAGTQSAETAVDQGAPLELDLDLPGARPELTGDEAAAAQEVAAIEAELTADGVELVALGPEDFVADEEDIEVEAGDDRPRRRRRRGGRGRRGGRRLDGDDADDGDDAGDDGDGEGDDAGEPDTDTAVVATSADDGEAQASTDDTDEDSGEGGDRASTRRRRRRRGSRAERAETQRGSRSSDEVTALKGSTRLEAKRQRRREGRDAGRRRQVITEAEFLARRESVTRSMVVRERDGRTQIAVLEDGVLVEHYVSQQSQASMVGNVYLGRVQNVLPSMEAAFVEVGKGRNAVLYAGEVNWDAAGLDGGQPRRIEQALKSGDSVLVQVTKDPIGHKGARLTSQITLAGRYLVLVPGGGMTGISRKLPDGERTRLKKILREIVPEGSGVIVRTAAEGATSDELRADVERLQNQWAAITTKVGRASTSAPALLQGEPDLAIRVVRDIFNDDFSSLVVQGDGAWQEIAGYVEELAPDLRERVTQWAESTDVFAAHRVDEQLAKGMDRKVWLPSGGSLVIDRTEAMTVVDVNTGKFTGTGGTLEETVTRNNLEAAEEIVRQLRLRDIGGIIVIDFIDMVLESNRDLVLRRLVECLGRDRTKHQVAEVTSLGLVQMTRKRVGQGLVEAFSETCEHCKGRGFVVHTEPNEKGGAEPAEGATAAGESKRSRRKRATSKPAETVPHPEVPKLPDDKSEAREAVKATLATIAAAAAHAHDHPAEH